MTANSFTNLRISSTHHFTLRHGARFTRVYPTTRELKELLARAWWYEELWKGPGHFWAVTTYQDEPVELAIHLTPSDATIKTVYQQHDRRARRLNGVHALTGAEALEQATLLASARPAAKPRAASCEMCGRAAACAPTRVGRCLLHACPSCQKHGMPTTITSQQLTIRIA